MGARLHLNSDDKKSVGILDDWKHASGLRACKYETNSMLCPRDYSVKCEIGSEAIVIVEGIWVWWCKTHHQPELMCAREKLAGKLLEIGKLIEEIH